MSTDENIQTGRLIIGTGASGRLHEWIGGALDGRRIAVVSDREVGGLHLDAFLRPLAAAGAQCVPIIVDAVGAAKLLDAVKTVVARMADSGFTESDLLVGLGGGGVLDVAWFCAYLYRGGLQTVMVPTSLSAMVSVADTRRACLHFPGVRDLLSVPVVPGLAVADPAFLSTLPKLQRTGGMAEVVRLAWLADPGLADRLEAGGIPDEELVRQAIRASAAAHAVEPAFLGFGRQVGDVIEEHFRFMKYNHGEACALGMLAVSRSDRLVALLERFSLPLRLEGVGTDTLARKFAKAFLPAVPPADGPDAAAMAVADEPGLPSVLRVPRIDAEAWFAAAAARITG